MHKSYWIYIVLCKDKTFYTGVTNDVAGRIWEHNHDNSDKNSYTYKRRPVKLVYCELFHDVKTAIIREKQVKGWSKRKKQALIDENADNLIKYSKRKYPNR